MSRNTKCVLITSSETFLILRRTERNMIKNVHWSSSNLITYSMVQSPWEANWFAASQEILRISRNTKAHYRTHKRPPLKASRMWVFLNKVFYREGLLAPRPTPKLEDHPSSAVRDCLFNIFAATLLIGGRSSSKLPIILVRFSRNLNFLDRFSKNTQISNLGGISPVKEMFHVDGETRRS